MLDKKRVKKLYISGYNTVEIAKILGEKEATVKKCVQRNFRDKFQKEHRYNRYYSKDCKRAIDSTNNRYIGDSQLVSWNRQSYTTNKNGTLIFDGNRGILPSDVPKRYRAII